MYERVDDVTRALPNERDADLLPLIRQEFVASEKTLVVLDDDPTGTQTCYDVAVLTSWSISLLVAELKKKPSILFILTNSRSMTEAVAVGVGHEIGKNLVVASAESGRDIAIISRSDSTLRGHFPAEVDAVAEALNIPDAIRVLVPAFIEGGRVTIDDVHYIHEQDRLIPVAETPFAEDAVFGYRHSNLKKWIEEKTKGKVRSEDVVSISIKEIRESGATGVTERLENCVPGQVCFANACSHQDLATFVMGLLTAEKNGKTFICRTSATFVPLRAGLPAGKIFRPAHEEVQATTGSLVIVGSYVPKTTRQLVNLLQENTHHAIEVNVRDLLLAQDEGPYTSGIIGEAEEMLTQGKNVVIHTSRQLEKGIDNESNLRINNIVSSFLVKIVQGLSVRPAFIVAKGGITSSDIATKALRAQKALVVGQVIPGVPVWKMDSNGKYPGIIYVVFPGNVGDDNALTRVCRTLHGTN